MTWAPRWMWGWPSWLVELLSGLVTVSVAIFAAFLCRYLWGLALVATILSLFYEKYIDGNGFDWDDVLERQIGILVGVVLCWHFLR
jgi:hypothetical protein